MILHIPQFKIPIEFIYKILTIFCEWQYSYIHTLLKWSVFLFSSVSPCDTRSLLNMQPIKEHQNQFVILRLIDQAKTIDKWVDSLVWRNINLLVQGCFIYSFIEQKESILFVAFLSFVFFLLFFLILYFHFENKKLFLF